MTGNQGSPVSFPRSSAPVTLPDAAATISQGGNYYQEPSVPRAVKLDVDEDGASIKFRNNGADQSNLGAGAREFNKVGAGNTLIVPSGGSVEIILNTTTNLWTVYFE